MRLFCIWTRSLKTSVGRLRALSSDLMVSGYISEHTALSHWKIHDLRWAWGKQAIFSVCPHFGTEQLSDFRELKCLIYMSPSLLMLLCLSVNRRKWQKTQRQILQGLSICIQLLCLGKVGIYKGSGVVKKWGILCEGEDVLSLKEGLICGYYCCLWSANRDLKLIHQSSTSLINSARWRCQNRLLLLSLMLPYHEVIKQVVQSKASKG